MTKRREVPLLDLRRQYAGIRSEIESALAGVMERQGFILGPEVEAFEAELADYCQVAHAVGCGSGSDALLLALMALDIGPGDDVVCPAYTFFATAGSIARLGARPVFADIDPATYNLDPESARQAVDRCTRLRAIIPVHLFGRMADMASLEKLAAECSVPLIEDAAQAIGARDARGATAGSLGAIACFSFYPTKNLGAFGEAGGLTTRDAGLADRLATLRVHGGQTAYYHSEVGVNSRLDALQAAVLRVKLRHLDGWTEARREHADYYDRTFASLDLPLTTPAPAPEPARAIQNQYTIRVPAERRDPLREHLAERGVGSAIYYPLGLHQQECFADLDKPPGGLPETEAAARETLALPVFPELERCELDHVIDSIASFFRN